MQISARSKIFVGLLAVVAYAVLLSRWFHDPGIPEADGFVLRSRVVWPFAVVFLGLALTWAGMFREQLRHSLRESANTFALDRIDALIVIAVLTISASYQLPAILYPAGVLDSDSVLPGIIAKHIADGRPAPPFIYTLAYGGTLASHLLAVMYKLTGPSVTGLILLTRGMYLLFVAVQFVVLRASLGRTVATLTTLLLAFPPQFLLTQLTYTELVEMLLTGALLIIVFAAGAAGVVSENLWYGLAGLLIGVGFWTQPLVMTFGIAGVATVLCMRGFGDTLRDCAPSLSGGAFIGLLPALVGWGPGVSSFAAWLAGSDGDHDAARGSLTAIRETATTGLPVLFGGYAEITLGVAGAALVSAAVIGPAAWALWIGFRALGRRNGSERSSERLTTAVLLALSLSVWIHLIIFVASPFGALVYPPRYLLPLYVGVPGLFVWAIVRMLEPLNRNFARLAAAVVVLLLIASGIPRSLDWMGSVRERHNNLHRSYTILLDEGVRYCEAPFWDAYWLTFYSLEEIICMPREFRRDPYYEKVVMAHTVGRFPHLVASPGHRWIPQTREAFDEQAIGYRYLETPTFEVLIVGGENSEGIEGR